MVVSEALDVAQAEIAEPKSPVAVGRHLTQRPIRNQLVIAIVLRLATIAGFTDLEILADQPNADPKISDCTLRHVRAARWFCHFLSALPGLSQP